MLRKISADYIFPISKPPLKNGILEIDGNGKIIEIIDTGGKINKSQNLEFYNGILVPGFINAHCHLELSHLAGKIPQKTGLPDFLHKMRLLKNEANDEIISKAMKKADKEMFMNGIVAVGDISNTEISFNIKKQSKIQYHTFIEVYGLDKKSTNNTFNNALQLEREAKNLSLSCSITPHSPYSLSEKLFRKIRAYNSGNRSTISIHNQESFDENLLFKHKSGSLYELINNIDKGFPFKNPTGKNSLSSILDFLPGKNKIILVHNTYTCEDDIEEINSYLQSDNLFWALCPRANLYIEDKLPDIELFVKKGQQIVLGTDSHGSNTSLSILEEMKVIAENFNNISLDEMIKWATLNGAKALGFDERLGSFDTGKMPGVILIENIDFIKMRLKSQSRIKKLY
ncbi:MAG: amidohydrolase family protein [Bacteroidia bacterium]|nr:amidohydrolase family protein [Bacteroidia bacterium]